MPSLPLEPDLIAARFSPDGQWILTHSSGAGFEPQSAILRSLKTLQPVGLPLRQDDGVSAACFSRDGRRVATGGEDGVARVWSVPGGDPLTPPMRHGSTVSLLAFGSEGRILATATSVGDVRLWDARTGEPLMPVRHHEGGVAAMSFVEGGPGFLVLGRGGVLHRWDCSPALTPVLEMERISTRLNGSR